MNKTSNISGIKQARGVTLVELMVAVTISLIIMAGVGVIFVNTKKSYNTQERTSRVQENGRFAMYHLMRNLRLAGYMGCLSDVTHFASTLNTPNSFNFNLTIPIEGIDRDSGGTAWSPSGNTDLPTGILPNTDAFVVRLVDPSTEVGISDPMPNTSAELKVTSIGSLTENDIILISDCSSADLMQLTQVQNSVHLQHNAGGGTSPGNATKILQKAYDENAKVFKYESRRFYIRNNPNGIPSLYTDVNGLATSVTELVEGIEDLQITYGVDTDADRQPNRYLKAGQAGLQSETEWGNVVAIRFAVLARTVNTKDTDTDSVTYDVNGRSYTPSASDPNDRHQRRVFTSTVLLRNLTKL